jgi:hypothetical protein
MTVESSWHELALDPEEGLPLPVELMLPLLPAEPLELLPCWPDPDVPFLAALSGQPPRTNESEARPARLRAHV